MNLNLNLIINLYRLKLLTNITKSNYYNNYSVSNLLNDLKLITKKNINTILFINIIMQTYNNKTSPIKLLKFQIKNYILLNQELITLLHYKSFLCKKTYSNYDLNMLYSISLLNDNSESIFDLNSNSIINIRKPYKATNSLLLKKTSLIDSILKKYIESNLSTNVSINFDKYNIAFVRKKSIFLKVLNRRMRRIGRLLRNSDLSLRTFIRVTFIFMCTKDIDLFSKILLKIMDSMHYKNHRKFLYYLKLFITKSMNFYFDTLKFEGFFFYLSGKISGGGNSKKKHYVVKHGKYSLTNKMLKLKYKKGLIHTKTGVMGYKFMISYR